MPADPSTATRGSSALLIAGLGLVLVTLAAYLPVLEAGFVWDDDAYVTANQTLRSLGGLWRIWTEPGAVPQFYPLTFTTLWLEYQLWGDAAIGYHVTNVVLHVATAVLVWRLLALLGVPGAWLAAVVFALHPVHVESVAWISERKNVLSGAFAMAALLALVRWAGLGAVPSRQRRDYVLGAGFLVAALLSKTVTATLPLAVLVLAWWRQGRLERWQVAGMLPLLAVGAASGVLTAFVERVHVGAVGPAWDLSLAQRILVAGRAVWFYVMKLVWPYPLMFIYPRWTPDAAVAWQWLFPVGAAAVAAGLLAARTRVGRGPLAAAVLFVITLAPALGFVDVYPMRYSFVADHFQYLASVPVLALLIAAGSSGLSGPWQPWMAAAMVMTLGALTWARVGAFHDARTLWADTLAKNPRAVIAHTNLGLIAYREGRPQEALALFDAGLAIEPDAADLRNNRGLVLGAMGRSADAEAAYRDAVRMDATQSQARSNLGNLLAEQGRLDEAVEQYVEAIRLEPEYADAHNNLGNVYAMQGKTDEAIEQYRKALEAEPTYAEAHRNLGELLFEAGDLSGARHHFAEAIAQQPEFAAARIGLGRTLVRVGRIPDGLNELRAGVRLAPGLARAHHDLAIGLAAAGQRDAALAEFARALEIDPTFPDAGVGMAVVLAEAERLEEAEAQLRRTLERHPTHTGARLQLGRILARRGRAEEAIGELRAVLAASPDWALAERSLAWTLATARDPKLRRPDEAVALAEKSARGVGQDADALDVLAAAYASAGRYDDAVRSAEQAEERARKSGAAAQREAIAARLALYRARRPWNEP